MIMEQPFLCYFVKTQITCICNICFLHILIFFILIQEHQQYMLLPIASFLTTVKYIFNTTILYCNVCVFMVKNEKSI